MKKFLLRIVFLIVTNAVLFSVHAQQGNLWPQTLPLTDGSANIYEPQVDSFSQNVLTAHAAVSFTPNGGSPIFGAMWFSANTLTDRNARTVQLTSFTITNSSFPQADQSKIPALTQALSQHVTAAQPTLSLDRLLASLADTQKEQSAAANLNNAPPQIQFVSYPAILVTIDGDPQLSPVPNSTLMRVVNTPFFIVLDPSTRTYYLNGAGQWLSSKNITGNWETAKNVPAAVTAYATTQAKSQNTTAQPNNTAAYQSQTMPKIIVATQPTELIQTDGPEEFNTISGTSLLYISNTQSDVFMDINSQKLYVLLSGRWYTAVTQQGPWTYVASNQLPADFSKIPAGSPKSDVLANVANTPAAKSAVMNASVPQTAAVKRTTPGPHVQYDGDPKFEAIQGTSLQYAVNTSHSVIKVENTYYCCADGVWYIADSALGPWVLAEAVPPPIYTIPPTSPVYNVTYCYAYNATPDVVYYGYLPGYLNSYVYGGTVVYGTGWPYQPWYGTTFIPRPVTWGFGAVYNPVSYAWGFGVGYAAGWGAGFGAWNTGWWGAGGYRPAYWNNNWNGNDWNRNVDVTNNYYNTTDNNIYNKNNTNTVENRSNNNVNRNYTNNDGNKVVDRENSNDENRRNAAGDRRNNVYAGNDGNVYRHSVNGWEQHSNKDNSWHSTGDSRDRDFQQHVQPSLNHDASARYSSGRSDYRSGGDSYRGGGSRGGGGRR